MIPLENKLDQCCILGEHKLDETFLTFQLLIDGFARPYRFYKNKHGREVMVYIQGKISSEILEKRIFLNDIECLFPELKRLSLFKEVATLRNVSSTISK